MSLNRERRGYLLVKPPSTPSVRKPSDRNNNGWEMKNWTIGVLMCLGLLLVIVLAASVTAIVRWFNTERQLDVYRYCLEFEGGDGVPDAVGGGDVNASGFGFFQVDTHARCLEWWFAVGNLDSTAASLELMGPLDTVNPVFTSALFKNLTVEGTGNVEFEDKVEIGKDDSKEIVRKPWQFYLLLKTASHPSGAVRAHLGRQCYLNENP